jgi:hypothetical protein
VASRFRNIRYLAGTSVRRIRQGGIRGLEEVWQAALSQRELPPLSSIGVWPPVQTGAELADLNARLGWYVPDTCSIDIPAVDRVMRTRLPFVRSSRTRNTPLIRCTVGTS